MSFNFYKKVSLFGRLWMLFWNFFFLNTFCINSYYHKSSNRWNIVNRKHQYNEFMVEKLFFKWIWNLILLDYDERQKWRILLLVKKASDFMWIHFLRLVYLVGGKKYYICQIQWLMKNDYSEQPLKWQQVKSCLFHHFIHGEFERGEYFWPIIIVV